MPNYSLVLNNKFQNRSFDDLLKPLAMYTDVYNEQENAIGELETKAGIWENMANEQTDPIAYAQYKKYADDLQQQANALVASGLNPQTRRNVLNMKKRYASEIAPIEQAYTALQEERKLRRNNKDQSTLYADDNLSIDSFLGGRTPNLYNVSGNELYQRGAQAAERTSSREYYDTKVKPLTKYYQEMIQTVGYSPELMYQFRQDMAAIPELRDEVYSILKEKGVEGNLTGANYNRALESVINGMIDGAIYKEARNTHQNQGVLTAAQAASNARAREGQALNAALHGMVPDGKGGYKYDITKDPKYAGNLWMYDIDEETGELKGIKPEYMNNNYKVNPTTGKLEKVSSAPKKNTTTTDPIYKLAGKKQLLNEKNGFSYLEGNDRHKYNYVGAISSHSSGKTWQSGNIGDDIPEHAFNWTSSNLSTSGGLDFWNAGNYTANHMGDNSRVLTDTEASKLMYNFGPEDEAAAPTAFGEEVEKYLTRYAKEHNLDVQEVANKAVLVEVPSKRGRNDYLVAIEE